MLLRLLAAFVVLLTCAGCATYMTPGGPISLDEIGGPNWTGGMRERPSPHFPATIAVVRVQAPDYRSFSAEGFGKGRFSIVPASAAAAPEQEHDWSHWPSVGSATALDRQLLPDTFDSIEDLRLAAAKLQVDILLIYTVDTQFQIKEHDYAPLSSVSLSGAADSAATITSTASAEFIDVRTGFTYGAADGKAKVTDQTKDWNSAKNVDAKRLATEHQAIGLMLTDAQKTWVSIAEQYQ